MFAQAIQSPTTSKDYLMYVGGAIFTITNALYEIGMYNHIKILIVLSIDIQCDR